MNSGLCNVETVSIRVSLCAAALQKYGGETERTEASVHFLLTEIYTQGEWESGISY